jgi:hypothetical protein
VGRDYSMDEVSGAFSLGVVQGLMQAAALVMQLSEDYSSGAVRAALGLTCDSLLEKVSELTAGREPPKMVTTPRCPLCSQPPALVLDAGHQAFCGTEGCPTLTWDMHQDLDTPMTHAAPVKITHREKPS